MPFPYQPYRTIPRPRNAKFLALTGVSIYPLSLPVGEQAEMGLGFPAAYGSFSSTQTQSIVIAPTVTSITYNTTDLAGGGVALSGATPTPSIRVPGNGVYRVITSVQLNKQPSGGSTGDVYIWFAVNGTAVPNSATKSAISNNIEQVMTVEVLLTLNAGDLVSIQSQATDLGQQALAEVATATVPAIPSIITIVQRIA